MRAIVYTLCLFVILLCTGCRSTSKSLERNTFATDSAVQVQRHQWQTSRIDSVWRHTELSFDSVVVSFGVGAETPTIEAHSGLHESLSAKAQECSSCTSASSSSRLKPQVIRIYGAQLSSSRKQSTKTEAREEDSLAATRQSSLQQQVLQRESTARPWTSPVKLGLTLVFLAALAAFWWYHRRDSDA